jgi:hypothetical protein
MNRRRCIVIRDEWAFEYEGKALTDAAQAKIDHHKGRFEWWRQEKEKIIAKIKAEGLEITEKTALQLAAAKSREWEHGAQVLIRNDLRTRLDEAQTKLGFHLAQLNIFQGWHQILSANPEANLRLDHEDWLFFFGRDQ